MIHRYFVFAVAATITLAASARGAGEDAATASSTMPSWQAGIRSSYTAASTAKFDDAKSGDNSDAYVFELSIGRKIKLDSSWSLLVGLGSQNIYLNSIAAARVPDEIHTFRLTTGLEFKASDKMTITGLVGPALYRLQDVATNDIGFSGGVMMAYRHRPTFSTF